VVPTPFVSVKPFAATAAPNASKFRAGNGHGVSSIVEVKWNARPVCPVRLEYGSGFGLYRDVGSVDETAVPTEGSDKHSHIVFRRER
jgi:hypothetical protein